MSATMWWTVWLVILLAGLGTFALRLSFIQLFSGARMPQRAERTMRFVPAAVLAALVLPALLLPGGVFDPIESPSRATAALVAAAVAHRTGNVPLTLCVGMGALWTLQALLA